MTEPNRTSGKAEGTVEATGGQNDVGKAGKASLPGGEPNRTPGKAEGTQQDAEQSLKAQNQK